MTSSKVIFKRMGVMNITPNSFSDGGSLPTLKSFEERLVTFGPVEALDIGAESTAPMNAPIGWQEEWERIEPFLDLILAQKALISLDTYHPETILKFAEIWLRHKKRETLIWNDVSGKFDESVRDFLSLHEDFQYVLCHNRAPSRALAGQHMEYVQEGDIAQELLDFFSPYDDPRVIFDPCLGFSKTYEENWWILEHLGNLQGRLNHWRWLIGFSRKSFLRKKYGTTDREELDALHVQELMKISPQLAGEVWIRTHRPELLSFLKE